MAPVVVAALSSSSNTANNSSFAAAITQTCFSSPNQSAMPPWEPNSSSIAPLHLSRPFPCPIPAVPSQRQRPVIPFNPSARSRSLNAPSQSLGNNSNSRYAAQRHSSFRCRGLDAVGLRKACLHVARASPLKGRSRQVLHRAGEQPSGLELHKPSLTSEHETEAQAADISTGEFTTNSSRRGGQESEDVEADKGPILESKLDKERQSNEPAEQEGKLITGDTALKGTIVAGLLIVGLVGGFGTITYLYRDQINELLIQLSDFIEGYGPAGYALFVAVYTGLEILAIPAIPLTMSAGLLFGTVIGTAIVSISGTIAATAAFLIARYLARDRILKLAEGNKKFLAIDKAIGEDGFKVVTLLRLSPLLPFSLGNYLYGLTSVKLVPYISGSWLGMLPGTWAYVSAGALGRAIIQQEAETGQIGSSEQLWTVGLGLLVTIFAATYVTRLAKDAIKDIE